jgi:hypothetical protein
VTDLNILGGYDDGRSCGSAEIRAIHFTPVLISKVEIERLFIFSKGRGFSLDAARSEARPGEEPGFSILSTGSSHPKVPRMAGRGREAQSYQSRRC